jgi:excisionase family DNA binding protein
MTASSSFRVREVASRLAVTEGRVLSWIRSGKLRALDVSEGAGRKHRWRILPADLAAFEASRAVVPAVRSSRRRSASGWVYRYF